LAADADTHRSTAARHCYNTRHTSSSSSSSTWSRVPTCACVRACQRVQCAPLSRIVLDSPLHRRGRRPPIALAGHRGIGSRQLRLQLGSRARSLWRRPERSQAAREQTAPAPPLVVLLLVILLVAVLLLLSRRCRRRRRRRRTRCCWRPCCCCCCRAPAPVDHALATGTGLLLRTGGLPSKTRGNGSSIKSPAAAWCSRGSSSISISNTGGGISGNSSSSGGGGGGGGSSSSSSSAGGARRPSTIGTFLPGQQRLLLPSRCHARSKSRSGGGGSGGDGHADWAPGVRQSSCRTRRHRPRRRFCIVHTHADGSRPAAMIPRPQRQAHWRVQPQPRLMRW
jgi:hypothetical protein